MMLFFVTRKSLICLCCIFCALRVELNKYFAIHTGHVLISHKCETFSVYGLLLVYLKHYKICWALPVNKSSMLRYLKPRSMISWRLTSRQKSGMNMACVMNISWSSMALASWSFNSSKYNSTVNGIGKLHGSVCDYMTIVTNTNNRILR